LETPRFIPPLRPLRELGEQFVGTRKAVVGEGTGGRVATDTAIAKGLFSAELTDEHGHVVIRRPTEYESI
jgi:hypothetical protein